MYNSTMPIQILPDEVASQIAAGEVVERPASVVKELIENALDAGAKSISVRCEGAGQRLIEVIDDGGGIPQTELSIAVIRHATSKLRSAEDLFRVGTLGFRGEALASIGSISRMTVTSRTRETQHASKVRIEGGRIGKVEQIGAPVGTAVIVQELFYNVPARRKFLKKDVTERRLIDELVTRYALAYPHVRFRLIQEGREDFRSSGSGDSREVLGSYYGVDIAGKMLEVLSLVHDIQVKGFISPISLTRSNRKEILFYVNGRPVQDVTLTTALIQAYHTLLMVGRYPMALIFLELPLQDVDVNVHPTKAEVRFRERDKVFSAVQRSARKALLAYTPVPDLHVQSRWDMDPHSGEATGPAWGGGGERADLMTPGIENSLQVNSDLVPEETSPLLSARFRMPLLRLVGQVASAYLIAEGPDGLYLIDQHAAHERVLFEKYLAARQETIPSQSLLEAVSVEFSPQAARLIASQLPVLSRLGFRVEEFGRNAFILRAIPSLLAGMDPEAALNVLVEDFEEDETPLKDEIEAKIIARVCKRAAVKAGSTLSSEEQKALLQDLELCASPRTCPHGRPTMIHLSVDLLERQFGRRGAR